MSANHIANDYDGVIRNADQLDANMAQFNQALARLNSETDSVGTTGIDGKTQRTLMSWGEGLGESGRRTYAQSQNICSAMQMGANESLNCADEGATAVGGLDPSSIMPR